MTEMKWNIDCISIELRNFLSLFYFLPCQEHLTAGHDHKMFQIIQKTKAPYQEAMESGHTTDGKK